MRTESPPVYTLTQLTPTELGTYLQNPAVNELIRQANYEYWYWTELRRRPLPPGVTAEPLWALTKATRERSGRRLDVAAVPGCQFSYQVTEPTLERLHHFDLHMGGILRADSLIPAGDKTQYLVNSIMEEAIASSQLEGAATTREVAKDMLRKKRKPRNQSERMIFNNYQTIQFILAQKNQPLTPALLCQIQALMTHDTLSSPEQEGRFRLNDEVRVEDSITGEVVHIPPAYQHLPALLDWYCAFANEELPKASGAGSAFIHPIVRASILHFLIGYIHPFVDGNGRTARAVFYWYLIRKGYWLVEYMSISRIIHKSAAQYARAYLHTEFDGNDLTYFINYQVRTLSLAFDSLQEYIQRKMAEKQQQREFRQLGDLNKRQLDIVRELITDPDGLWTIREVQHRYGVVYDTARTDLQHLETLGLLDKRREGKVKILYLRAAGFAAALERLREPG